jgi:hypothetical protein
MRYLFLLIGSPFRKPTLLLAFPRSLLSAALARLHRSLVAKRFAAYSRPPFSELQLPSRAKSAAAQIIRTSQISTTVGLQKEGAVAPFIWHEF